MGAVHFSIDRGLVERLRASLPLKVFVETGTFEGEAVSKMLTLFDAIHSVEVSDEHATQAALRFQNDQHVTVHHGHSVEVLKALREQLRDVSALYWLDAHWCDGSNAVEDHSHCELLGELAALEHLNDHSVVLIDDARLFLSPPPPPHHPDGWPSFHEVLRSLLRLSDKHRIMVVNDVILFFPDRIDQDIAEFARTNSIDWLASLHRLDALETERETLHAALEERLAAINELTRAVEELRSPRSWPQALVRRLRRDKAVARSASSE
jgi:hypothetical protein